jgi:hypothetical protein
MPLAPGMANMPCAGLVTLPFPPTSGSLRTRGDGHVMIDKALGVTSIQRVGLEKGNITIHNAP